MDEAKTELLTEILQKFARKELLASFRKPGEALPEGSTKIGGKPTVPQDFEWPYFEGTLYNEKVPKSRPLSFLAQINLKDIAGLPQENPLPESGILSFFYELETMQWGFDPKDAGCARVFYFPEETALSPAAFPDDLADYAILPELEMTFREQVSLPGCWDVHEIAAPFEDEDDDDYCDTYVECCEALGCQRKGSDDRTKLFGYPDAQQDPDMGRECETVTRGFRQGCPADSQKITDADRADIAEKAKDWTLLFQMGTIEDGDYELMFGDCGYIYFWIRKEDLVECRFDKCWLILQCG